MRLSSVHCSLVMVTVRIDREREGSTDLERMVSVPSFTFVEHVLEHFVPPIYATCVVNRGRKRKSGETNT